MKWGLSFQVSKMSQKHHKCAINSQYDPCNCISNRFKPEWTHKYIFCPCNQGPMWFWTPLTFHCMIKNRRIKVIQVGNSMNELFVWTIVLKPDFSVVYGLALYNMAVSILFPERSTILFILVSLGCFKHNGFKEQFWHFFYEANAWIRI